MAFTRLLSRTSRKIVFRALLFLIGTLVATDTEARFASRFSLSVGEEYNDNIFFANQREYDFITFIVPKLTFLYIPETEIQPTFTFDIAPTGQIYARHSERNNFGFSENAAVNSGYTYQVSPRLSLHLSDSLRTRGRSRTQGGLDDNLGSVDVPTGFPLPGSVVPSGSQGQVGDVTLGDVITNQFSLHGKFLYSPDITVTGSYSNGFTAFVDQGGNQLNNSFGVRGVYHWLPEHNLHAGFRLGIIKSRTGEDNLVYSFDLGDDYFSSRTIQLAPTLTLSLATGLSLNVGKGGPRVANNSSATLIKIWERAQLSAGVRKALTDSLGVAGLSDTTTLSSNFNIRLTEHLTGSARANYSFYDTNQVNFSLFNASAGLQYWITTWLSSSLTYTHRFRDSGAGAQNTSLRNSGNAHSNSVVLVFTSHFDIWPNVGLANALTPSFVYPVVLPQSSQPSDPVVAPTPSPTSPTPSPVTPTP